MKVNLRTILYSRENSVNSSDHIYMHLTIYFGSPFSRSPTFHALTSVGRKKLFCMSKI